MFILLLNILKGEFTNYDIVFFLFPTLWANFLRKSKKTSFQKYFALMAKRKNYFLSPITVATQLATFPAAEQYLAFSFPGVVIKVFIYSAI